MKVESSFNLFFTILSYSDNFQVDLVRQGFPLEPDIARKKGQLLSNNQISDSNKIRFSRKNISSSELESRLQEFVGLLGSQTETSSLYLTNNEASISLDIVGDLLLGTARPTLFFTMETIKIIASLNCNFNIEIYAVDESNLA